MAMEGVGYPLWVGSRDLFLFLYFSLSIFFYKRGCTYMKTTRFELRLSDDTKAKWQQNAIECGLTLSEWIHRICNYEIDTDVPVRTEVEPLYPPVEKGDKVYVRKHHPQCKCDSCRGKK